MKRPWSHMSKLAFGVVFTLGIFFTSCENVREPLAPNSDTAELAKKPATVKPAANGQINILLNTEITDAILAELEQYGTVVDVLDQINAVILKVKGKALADIQALSFVETANPDAERNIPPFDFVEATDFSDGLSTWNLDAVNVTDFGFNNRTVEYDGETVYMGVLDTGLLHTWRSYFPEERIAEQYARSFGGGPLGATPTQPNKWEHDTNSHGTHVTSTVIGYSLGNTPVNGVAPKVNVIPVKVLNQNGSGWSSVISAGITYMGDLKAGPLSNYPVIVNMSLGGSALDAVEKAAIDYAISQGVIIVASAGNNGEAGMGYPGAYEPVISVAASGWVQQFSIGPWWYALDLPEGDDALSEYYIPSFSSVALPGQDLDVTAPGSFVVGPYQLQMGQLSYYFLSGTSMAAPHVAGIVALMAQKYPELTAENAETILTGAATPFNDMYYGSENFGSGFVTADAALGLIP